MCDGGEGLELGAGNRLLALQRAQFGGEPVTVGIAGAANLFAQAGQIAFDNLQFRLDRAAIEFARSTASSASTVQRSGVTSAMPPTTKMRSEIAARV